MNRTEGENTQQYNKSRGFEHSTMNNGQTTQTEAKWGNTGLENEF